MDPVTAFIWFTGLIVGSLLLNSISTDIRIVKTEELELKQTELKYQQKQVDLLLKAPRSEE